jgi:hypothetical protein
MIMDNKYESLLKTNLLEIKESKINLKIKEQLFNNRLSFIVESNLSGKSIRRVPKKVQIKTFLSVVNEVNSSNEYGYVLEQEGLNDLLRGLFGNSFDTVSVSIVEPLSKSILTKVGLSGSILDNAVSNFVNDKTKLFESFKSCESMAHAMSQIIEVAMIDDIRKNTSPDGIGNSFIKNHLIDTIQSNDNFLTSLKEKLKPIVCDIYNKFIDRAKRIESALKEPMV